MCTFENKRAVTAVQNSRPETNRLFMWMKCSEVLNQLCVKSVSVSVSVCAVVVVVVVELQFHLALMLSMQLLLLTY